MFNVKCVVVIVVLLLSVDVGRSWFAGCGRQASLHFPFINSKQHLLWGRLCVCCLATAKGQALARSLLISYIPSLVKRMWLRAAWHQLWARSSSNRTFSSLLANHILIPRALCVSARFMITLCLSVWHIFFFQIKDTAKRGRSKHGIGEAKATTWRFVKKQNHCLIENAPIFLSNISCWCASKAMEMAWLRNVWIALCLSGDS